MKFIIFLNTLFLSLLLNAQQLNLEMGFDFVKGSSDTIYLVKDEYLEDGYLIFKDKESLSSHFNKQNFEKTGEIVNEYMISVEETKDFYISKNNISEEDYRIFCEATNRPSPESLTSENMETYCDYLSGLWDIPVRLSTDRELAYDVGYRLVISKFDWDIKPFLDKINGYMKEAYNMDVPAQFTYNSVETESKTIKWEDIRDMRVERQKQKVIIKGTQEAITFHYTEEQYASIASMHVYFLAFLSKIRSEY